MEDLSNYRKIYDKERLLEETVDENPFMQFRKWFHEVDEAQLVEEVNAMAVSTLGLDGFPKSRIVLLKSYDENGFVFYTNYLSEKGRAIEKHKEVCLHFFWPKAERQIIIKGIAEKVSEQQSENYFYSRPLGSQIGAIVSKQSSVIRSYKELEDEVKKIEERKEPLKKPKDWGGYLVRPVSFEFWQGRPNRLHDRIRYTLEKYDWKIERLAP